MDAYKVRFRARFAGSPEAMEAFVVEGFGGPDQVPTAEDEDWGCFDLENFAPFPDMSRDWNISYGRFCARVFDAEPTASLLLDSDPDLRNVIDKMTDPELAPAGGSTPRTLAELRDCFTQFANDHNTPFDPLAVAHAYRENEARFGAGTPREWVDANWGSEIDDGSCDVDDVTRDPMGLRRFELKAEAYEGFPQRLFETVAHKHPGVRIAVEIDLLDSDESTIGHRTWSANTPTSKARTAAPGMG